MKKFFNRLRYRGIQRYRGYMKKRFFNGDYLYVDYFGNVYLLVPTGQPEGTPLTITLMVRS